MRSANRPPPGIWRNPRRGRDQLSGRPARWMFTTVPHMLSTGDSRSSYCLRVTPVIL